MSKSPYGSNIWGHANICDCPRCVQGRLNVYKDRVENMHNVDLPATDVPLVPVRAHFRKVKNFLGRYPNTQKRVVAYLRRNR